MTEPKPLWQPSKDKVASSNIIRFMRFVEEQTGQQFTTYEALYDWSVTERGSFWKAVWEFTDVVYSRPFVQVVEGEEIRTAKWFEGARLNFAENLMRYRDEQTAIIYWTEHNEPVRISYRELYKKVTSCVKAFRDAGVTKGDRVAAFITNRPEAIIGMLAASSIGAIWSSCSPDFGFQGVLDRFGQIQPKLLIATDGYSYNGNLFDSTDTIQAIVDSIDSIEKVIVIDSIGVDDSDLPDKSVRWNVFTDTDMESIEFEQLPFDHPLYIMYSSGTTGKPKCIVHGAGGTLLQHLKELILHTDLKREDVITYYTTCGWMMWNWLVSSLAVGATVFLYDGSPGYPSLDIMFEAIDEEKITVLGTSPKFLSSCEAGAVRPNENFDLDSLRAILSTGAPLSVQNFEYVYKEIKEDVQLASISGGTDIISCFMLGCPILPVYAGELQCRGLGMKVETYNDTGKPVQNEVGELVCTAPFPSRPIYFWNDEKGEKYHNAYFAHYDTVWRHGDYIKINDHGGVVVYGRSDATLNPGGVRIGTAEIYGPVEAMDEVEDSIVVGKKTGDDTEIILFVVLTEGKKLTDELKEKINATLRKQRTPRHVPKNIYQVSAVPHTLNGKKVELAVTKLLHGQPISNRDALANPEVLDEFTALFEN